MSNMDFDLCKENIQPLRRGRNVHQLEIALQADMNPEYQRQLIQRKEEFEAQIQSYQGDDPLQNYFEYISWIEQSYPKSGHEGNCAKLLEYCLGLFENDPRYTNDLRFCRLWIKYNDMFPNPEELYLMMKSKNLCTGLTEFYKAWSYYYEAADDYQSANKVLEEGKKCLAQPYDDLETAQNNLIIATGQRELYGRNEVRLNEKRQALISLASTHSGRVGSVRNPATGGSNGISETTYKNKTKSQIGVFEDQAGSSRVDEAAPRSIISVAKRQISTKENVMKPGPWTSGSSKRPKCLNQRTQPQFEVYGDDDEPSQTGCLPANLPQMCLEDYSTWKVSLLNMPDEYNPKHWYGYPKHLVYGTPDTEFSIEELRSRRYQKKQQVTMMTEEDDDECLIVSSGEGTSTIRHSPWKSQMDHQNFLQDVFSHKNEPRLSVNFANDEVEPPANFRLNFDSPPREFQLYEQSSLEQPPKGNAMKTAFRTLNADEVETGSRGGMDGATAAQPADEARPMPFTDDSSSSDDSPYVCNTQQFNFNLNAMKVSTPENYQQKKRHNQLGENSTVNEQDLESARKALFGPVDKLSMILEEKSGSVSTSSSSGATTKSSLYMPQNRISTISEEHSSYLEQNLKANEELRRSLLGNIMEESIVVVPTKSTSSSSPMQQSPVRRVPHPTLARPLEFTPNDPFSDHIISQLLERVVFPGCHSQGFIRIDGNPRISVKKEPVFIGRDQYIIEKQLGKGQFGTVYKAYSYQMQSTVALKHQKPPNRWEFYICRELLTRLTDHPLRECFMDIQIGYFNEQASFFVSKFVRLGSLLDAANMMKNPVITCKDKLAAYFTLHMLRIVKTMHEAKIIHADIKPDNFLMVQQPNNLLGLQLIDFGCSIDMTLFPDGSVFDRIITTEDFICCEVLDGRPWSYHTDLFCIAASAHVLLFHKYMQMTKGKDGRWAITNRFKRSAKQDLWHPFFNNLLNQQNGPADIAALERQFETEVNLWQNELHLPLTSLLHMLKNR